MIEGVIIDGLAFALPLFVMALGGIYSERSGITNLALEGLQGFGAFTGALTASLLSVWFTGNTQMIFYGAIIFAILGGMLYSLLHALLCIRFGANQVVSGVVVNLLAISLTVFLTKSLNSSVFGKPSDKFILDIAERITIPVISEIPVLGAFFTDLYPFEIIIVVITGLAWYILYKTRYGMHLLACGDNPHAVDAAGVSVARVRYLAVAVSGGMSGLAGISFAYSISANFSGSIYVGYGYLSIAAIIFGNWKIVPTLGACLLFGVARAGGFRFVQILNLPGSYSDLVMTLPYVLTLLLLVFFSKNNHPPRALGEAYDKGKR